MKSSKKYDSVIRLTAVVAIGLLIGVLSGCQKKQEEPQTKETPQATKTVPVDTAKVKQKEPVRITAPDIKGVWSGKFDGRATKLTITEQSENEFKGKITINYREVINQQVSGRIDPDTKKVTMKDLLHSRFQGRYAAQLSEDSTKLSGTFTMDIDGMKLSFSLSKK